MFEAEATTFRSAGIRIGADQSIVERSLLEETLAPFSVTMRDEALQMSRLYALLYCFENSVRALIKERLQEKYALAWWTDGVPPAVRRQAESRQKDAEKNSWLDAPSRDVLSFTEFGNLADIIVSQWDLFSDLVPTQHWLKQRMEELEKARNFLAHNRLLLPGEFQRIEMYVSDWNRMWGCSQTIQQRSTIRGLESRTLRHLRLQTL
jgi:hypothetical protein